MRFRANEHALPRRNALLLRKSTTGHALAATGGHDTEGDLRGPCAAKSRHGALHRLQPPRERGEMRSVFTFVKYKLPKLPVSLGMVLFVLSVTHLLARGVVWNSLECLWGGPLATAIMDSSGCRRRCQVITH